MLCPTCCHPNLPGNEECSNCGQALTPLDLPMAADPVEKSLLEELVVSLRPRAAVTISPTATVQDAIQAMLTHDIGALIVVDKDGTLLGIFSERDLLVKVAGLHRSYAELPVGQFMTSDPVTIPPDATLGFAVQQMDIGGYRHIPVATDGRPSGVVSVRDMLRHITRLCKHG